MKYFNVDKFNKLAEEKHLDYVNNSPFSHAVFYDLFDNDVLTKIYNEFPVMEEIMKNESNKAVRKKLSFFQPDKLKFFEPITKEFCLELNSPEFCIFLEKLTGINNIQSDPYFEGGGPHSIQNGGFLKMHVDFNVHPISFLDRRINVLVYLNDNWPDEYGGNLDLWDTEMGSLKKSISPKKNTTVIFNTTENSWHGHPDPMTCPEDRYRRSLAFYFYTKPIVVKERHSTIYKPRNEKDFKVKKRK